MPGDGLPPGCETLGPPEATGLQCDPTSQGNGTFDQESPPQGGPPEADGDPRGDLSGNQSIQSTVFGYSFNYRLYVPAEYEAGKPASLIIFQDGGNYLGNFRVPTVIDSLIDSGEMPVTIAAFIEPTGQRSVEYDSRNDRYPEFIVDEFVPQLETQYDLVQDPNGWAIGGHSSGGGCAFNVAWHHPEKFRKVMTHMGTFVGLQDPGNDDYRQMVREEDAKPLRVNLLSGTNDLQCCGETWFNANNDMAEGLEEAGYAFRYMVSTTSHDPNPWASGDFPEAMRWLWRGYTLPH
jgi:enterochelin esterase family protein